MLGISRVVERVLASQQELGSIELISSPLLPESSKTKTFKAIILQEGGENYATDSFIICNLRRIILWRI
jgi:hypothetical protein